MKRTRTIAALTAAVITFSVASMLNTSANATVKVAAPKLKLLWSQEFNNQRKLYPDTKVWNYDLGNNGGWGNNENEYYTTTNAITQGICSTTGYKVKTTDQRVCLKSKAKNLTATGALNIFAKKIPADDIAAESCASCLYFSSRLNTKGKFSFKYGKLEARIWMPRGDGTWPAFWLLGRNIDQKGWPNSGEIDIVEGGRDAYTALGTTHGPHRFGSEGITNEGYVNSKPLSAGWHTYGLIWTTSYFEWTVDGQPYFKLTKSEMVNNYGETWTGVFDQPFFMIINLAMGGWFVGGSPDPNITTASMKIDWIRYHSYNGLGTLYKR